MPSRLSAEYKLVYPTPDDSHKKIMMALARFRKEFSMRSDPHWRAWLATVERALTKDEHGAYRDPERAQNAKDEIARLEKIYEMRESGTHDGAEWTKKRDADARSVEKKLNQKIPRQWLTKATASALTVVAGAEAVMAQAQETQLLLEPYEEFLTKADALLKAETSEAVQERLRIESYFPETNRGINRQIDRLDAPTAREQYALTANDIASYRQEFDRLQYLIFYTLEQTGSELERIGETPLDSNLASLSPKRFMRYGLSDLISAAGRHLSSVCDDFVNSFTKPETRFRLNFTRDMDEEEIPEVPAAERKEKAETVFREYKDKVMALANFDFSTLPKKVDDASLPRLAEFMRVLTDAIAPDDEDAGGLFLGFDFSAYPLELFNTAESINAAHEALQKLSSYSIPISYAYAEHVNASRYVVEDITLTDENIAETRIRLDLLRVLDPVRYAEQRKRLKDVQYSAILEKEGKTCKTLEELKTAIRRLEFECDVLDKNFDNVMQDAIWRIRIEKSLIRLPDDFSSLKDIVAFIDSSSADKTQSSLMMLIAKSIDFSYYSTLNLSGKEKRNEIYSLYTQLGAVSLSFRDTSFYKLIDTLPPIKIRIRAELNVIEQEIKDADIFKTRFFRYDFSEYELPVIKSTDDMHNFLEEHGEFDDAKEKFFTELVNSVDALPFYHLTKKNLQEANEFTEELPQHIQYEIMEQLDFSGFPSSIPSELDAVLEAEKVFEDAGERWIYMYLDRCKMDTDDGAPKDIVFTVTKKADGSADIKDNTRAVASAIEKVENTIKEKYGDEYASRTRVLSVVDEYAAQCARSLRGKTVFITKDNAQNLNEIYRRGQNEDVSLIGDEEITVDITRLISGRRMSRENYRDFFETVDSLSEIPGALYEFFEKIPVEIPNYTTMTHNTARETVDTIEAIASSLMREYRGEARDMVRTAVSDFNKKMLDECAFDRSKVQFRFEVGPATLDRLSPFVSLCEELYSIDNQHGTQLFDRYINDVQIIVSNEHKRVNADDDLEKIAAFCSNLEGQLTSMRSAWVEDIVEIVRNAFDFTPLMRPVPVTMENGELFARRRALFAKIGGDMNAEYDKLLDLSFFTKKQVFTESDISRYCREAAMYSELTASYDVPGVINKSPHRYFDNLEFPSDEMALSRETLQKHKMTVRAILTTEDATGMREFLAARYANSLSITESATITMKNFEELRKFIALLGSDSHLSYPLNFYVRSLRLGENFSVDWTALGAETIARLFELNLFDSAIQNKCIAFESPITLDSASLSRLSRIENMDKIIQRLTEAFEVPVEKLFDFSALTRVFSFDPQTIDEIVKTAEKLRALQGSNLFLSREKDILINTYLSRLDYSEAIAERISLDTISHVLSGLNRLTALNEKYNIDIKGAFLRQVNLEEIISLITSMSKDMNAKGVENIFHLLTALEVPIDRQRTTLIAFLRDIENDRHQVIRSAIDILSSYVEESNVSQQEGDEIAALIHTKIPQEDTESARELKDYIYGILLGFPYLASLGQETEREVMRESVRILETRADRDIVARIIETLNYKMQMHAMQNDVEEDVLAIYERVVANPSSVASFAHKEKGIALDDQILFREAIGHFLFQDGVQKFFNGDSDSLMRLLALAEQGDEVGKFLGSQFINAAEKFTGEIAKRTEALIEQVLPKSPPYELLPADGTIRTMLYCLTDEFLNQWEGSVLNRGNGFTKTSFEMNGRMHYRYSRSVPDADGKPAANEVIVPKPAPSRLEFEDAIFENIKNPDIFLYVYFGHMGGGNELVIAFEKAPQDEQSKAVRKVIMVSSCGSLPGYGPEIRRLYQNAQLLGNRETTYGVDDGIIFDEMLKGFAKRLEWDEIRKNIHERFERSAYLKSAPEGVHRPENMVFPNDKAQLAYFDSDNDGIPDGRDDEFNLSASLEARTFDRFLYQETAVTQPPRQNLMTNLLPHFAARFTRYSGFDVFKEIRLMERRGINLPGWFNSFEDMERPDERVEVGPQDFLMISGRQREYDAVAGQDVDYWQIAINTGYQECSPTVLKTFATFELCEHFKRYYRVAEEKRGERTVRTVEELEKPLTREELSLEDRLWVFIKGVDWIMHQYKTSAGREEGREQVVREVYEQFRERYKIPAAVTFDIAYKSHWSKKYAGNVLEWLDDPVNLISESERASLNVPLLKQRFPTMGKEEQERITERLRGETDLALEEVIRAFENSHQEERRDEVLVVQ